MKRYGLPLLPLAIGMASVVVQALWHDYYWGIRGKGEYVERQHAVAWPLWFGSAALFGAISVFAAVQAWRRAWLERIATVGSVVLGGLLLLGAAVAGLMGGA